MIPEIEKQANTRRPNASAQPKKGRMVPHDPYRVLPPRPPHMRDDDIPFAYGSEREFDVDWFPEHRPSEFRVLSATRGDLYRAGLDHIPEGCIAVRLSYFARWMREPKVITFWLRVEDVAWFKLLPEYADDDASNGGWHVASLCDAWRGLHHCGYWVYDYFYEMFPELRPGRAPPIPLATPGYIADLLALPPPARAGVQS